MRMTEPFLDVFLVVVISLLRSVKTIELEQQKSTSLKMKMPLIVSAAFGLRLRVYAYIRFFSRSTKKHFTREIFLASAASGFPDHRSGWVY